MQRLRHTARSLSCSTCWAFTLADALGTVSAAQYDEIIEELLRLPGKMEQMLENIEDIKHLASNYFNHNSVFFIGRNLDYAMGLEGSLKLKEISYIHSEAYASGELKHGTISLIEDGTLVIALGTYEPLFDKAMSNIVEVQARGADVLALTTESRRCRDEKDRGERHFRSRDTHDTSAFSGRCAASAFCVLCCAAARLRYR